MVYVSYASIIADDIESLCRFYASVLGLPELTEQATDIYRALDGGGGLTLAFSATAVYDMLGIAEYRPAKGTRQYLTFEVDSDADVDKRSKLAVNHGARTLHESYVTSYDTYQAVLADPEANVFRINHSRVASKREPTL